MKGCKLIVHADDFGISEHVNQGILQAHTKGILTSTSLMATGAAFENAIVVARETPSLDIGIHLTLVEEKPLLDAASVPSLTTANKHFYNHANTFIKRYFKGKINLKEVRNELEAQIERILDQGISVSHFDSHQHLHALPKIRMIVIELGRKYGIPAIRVPRERIFSYMLRGKRALSRAPSMLVLNFLCGLGQNTGYLHTDHFAGFFFGGELNGENIRILLRHLPDSGSCELMCHPGLERESEQYDHWGYHWQDEYNALIDPEIKDLLRQSGITLISYQELAAL